MATFTRAQADALVFRLLDPREIFEGMNLEGFDALDRMVNDCDRLRSNLRTNRVISFLSRSERAVLAHIVFTAPPEDKRVLKYADKRIATIPVEG